MMQNLLMRAVYGLLWIDYFSNLNTNTHISLSNLTSQHYVVYHPLQVVIAQPLLALRLLEIFTAP